MVTQQGDPWIVGLDVGTSKVATVVARKTPEGVEVLGAASFPTEGMRRGAVVNVDATVRSIRGSVEEAEKGTGRTIEEVFLGVSGPLIKSFNSHAAVSVRNEREVSEADVERVLAQARSVEIPNDREILHVLTQEFLVDDAGGIPDPRGMAGIRLDARVHVVTHDVPATKNLVKCVERADLAIADLVLGPLASSEAVLTKEEKEVGVVLLDFGAGTVEMAIFYGNSLRHTYVLPLGGGNITADLAVGLRVPSEDAENLKKTSGCAAIQKVRRDELVELPGVGGRQPRPIRRQYLSEIIEPRAEEIFSLLRREILRSGCDDLVGAGIVLTGGGSLLDGLLELGERVFQLPIRRGLPIGLVGSPELVGSPSFATAAGLVLYGARAGAVGRVPGEAEGWMERIRRLLSEYF